MDVVIFDLDDTLYKERAYVQSGCRAVARELAIRFGFATAEMLKIIETAPSVSEGFNNLIRYINENSQSQIAIGQILDMYRNHLPEIQLPEETRELLDYLQSANIPMGIITDGRSFAQRAKIRALGLQKYIPNENIIISEEIQSDKHKPTGFLQLADRFTKSISDNKNSTKQIDQSNSSAESFRFFYIGDNPRKDFYWPNRLGWTTVQLLDPEGVNIKPPIQAPQEYRPTYTISHLEDFIQLLND